MNNVTPILNLGITSKNANVKLGYNTNKQMTGISNICYKPLTFGRSLEEHKSWGAYINPKTKEASFKLLTFPDAKRVTVTVEKQDNEDLKTTYELENQGNGIFKTKQPISPDEVSHGDKYFYTIYKQNGEKVEVKDPYTFKQESILGASTIYDQSLYKWNDEEWYSHNPNRISRNTNNLSKLTPVKDARIFELNIASFTKDGTFEGAKEKLNSIKELGFNAVEIMPVENTYSFNWGYDGVDKFATAEHLGGPDGLKDFVDYAHNLGINVIMDMVPNHIGPDGAALLKTGPYVGGNNCFGEAWNFEGKNSKYVRDFMVNAALNWIDNYHCDGLRLDMTKFMNSDYTMKQIAAEVNYHKPDAFLIAEDGRSDKRVVSSLKQHESGEGLSEKQHCNAIDKISNSETSLDNLGFDSEWDFDYFHSLNDGLYGVINLDRFENACCNSNNKVKYIMSHDEIGNFEGSRLIPKLMVPMLHLNDNVILDDNDIKRASDLQKLKQMNYDDAKRTVTLQKAQFTAEKLAMMLQKGELDKYNTKGITSEKYIEMKNQAFKKEVLAQLGIKESSGITFDSVQTMYQKSFNKNKMALARTYSLAGPKMVFQGDERTDLTPFRFFREFDSVKNEDYLYTEKGYNTGKPALNESTIGNIHYSKHGRDMMNYFRHLTKDLNKLNEENPALTNGTIIYNDTIKHPVSQVFATHSADNASNNEIFTITNFNDDSYPRHNAAEYYIKFPEGDWEEILNTDSTKYGGTGEFMNTKPIKGDGQNNIPIKLAGDSTIMFRKIN
jgi:1,4-alpha-glucan branching enzyme